MEVHNDRYTEDILWTIIKTVFTKNNQNLSDTMIEIESKTQKVVTALYLISDLIDENDPLRRDIRNLSVELSSLIGTLAIESPSKAKKTITEAQNHIDRIQNILKVCVSVGFVSDMNFKIISDHLTFVRDDLNKKYGLINSQALIASSFHNKAIHEFILPDSILKDTADIKEKKESVLVKDFEKPTKQEEIKSQKPKPQKDTPNGQASNGQRVEKILSVIKQKGEVSVSDVAREFPELSEKTMQRMLIKLVETGTLSKTGEKRWSRYSLIV